MPTPRIRQIGFALLLGFAWPDSAGADAVTTWNANAGKAALAACISPADDPLHESRMYAAMHIAIHDALNAIRRESKPYAYDVRVTRPTSRRAAVAAAARDVLAALIAEIPAPFPGACIEAGLASVEADYTAALAAIPDGAAKTRGIRLGQAAAAAILARRAGDGSDTPLIDLAYPQGTEPGEWRFTPDVPFSFATGWGNVKPFALKDAAQFRPKPPYAVTSRRYADDLNEVKALGGNDVTGHRRTADQTEVALFWVESSPLQWNRIARAVSEDRHLSLWENARLFGLLNIALADGYIASWSTKYHYSFWRPVTAIRLADADGNPKTAADPNWTPLRTTPPIPDYESGHSVQGGAGAQVLKRIFGDRVHFTACSLSLPEGSRCGEPGEVRRSYRSFSQAADENGVSRILVGFHFRLAVEEGIRHGRRVADEAVDRVLRPLR